MNWQLFFSYKLFFFLKMYVFPVINLIELQNSLVRSASQALALLHYNNKGPVLTAKIHTYTNKQMNATM